MWEGLASVGSALRSDSADERTRVRVPVRKVQWCDQPTTTPHTSHQAHLPEGLRFALVLWNAFSLGELLRNRPDACPSPEDHLGLSRRPRRRLGVRRTFLDGFCRFLLSLLHEPRRHARAAGPSDGLAGVDCEAHNMVSAGATLLPRRAHTPQRSMGGGPRRAS